jgi:hypothetical protein
MFRTIFGIAVTILGLDRFDQMLHAYPSWRWLLGSIATVIITLAIIELLGAAYKKGKRERG